MAYMQACLSYLRLNINTFSCFLRLLYDELEHDKGESLPQSRGRRDAASGSVTPLMARLLPLLRLSSAWLLTNDHLLNAEVGDKDLKLATNDLWHTYAKTLSALARAFPVVQLPEVAYLLEEDVESLGFKPLLSDRSQKLWKAQDSQKFKPKFNDSGVKRLGQEQEMLARIRDIVIDALLLAVADVSFLVMQSVTIANHRGRTPPLVSMMRASFSIRLPCLGVLLMRRGLPRIKFQLLH